MEFYSAAIFTFFITFLVFFPYTPGTRRLKVELEPSAELVTTSGQVESVKLTANSQLSTALKRADMANSKLTVITNLKLVAATTSSLHHGGHGQLSSRLVNSQASGQAEIRVDLVVDGAGHVVVEGGLDGGGQG